ncbi:transporter substrate-binding domain-containing protein [Cellulomonas pakistanensis]|uniref:ABC transporter substrate-binding protein n=1 Tax=Cellulomonas pakistanensis TaxID=992287 RepID=A0A919PB81_9CELL|nr:transporter substrate-binding domain-containing protein [Cellulomonas pakistanensis]GIG36988.1 ABC transporter substrate-binding protein [Cellulomonas pakistanensis]
MARTARPLLTGLLVPVALAALAGCSGGFPADPDGTLERVTGDVLRVGITDNPPWTEAAGGAPPGGLEAELATEFAGTLDAEVDWTVGSEEVLIRDLEAGELDLVVGGFTGRSPWSKQAALTTPYTTVPDEQGKPEPHVMAAPLGENAFLVRLETFLLQNHRDVLP